MNTETEERLNTETEERLNTETEERINLSALLKNTVKKPLPVADMNNRVDFKSRKFYGLVTALVKYIDDTDAKYKNTTKQNNGGQNEN